MTLSKKNVYLVLCSVFLIFLANYENSPLEDVLRDLEEVDVISDQPIIIPEIKSLNSGKGSDSSVVHQRSVPDPFGIKHYYCLIKYFQKAYLLQANRVQLKIKMIAELQVLFAKC